MITWHGVVKMELQGIHSAITDAEYLIRQAQEKAMTGGSFFSSKLS
jgi:hypothetical protein